MTETTDHADATGRRAMLRGAALGLGAAVAGAVLLPESAQAIDGGSLTLGQGNTATSQTQLISSASTVSLRILNTSLGGNYGLDAPGGSAFIAAGRVGVIGNSTSSGGTGVLGAATSTTSNHSSGVRGNAAGAGNFGVLGFCEESAPGSGVSGVGVLGVSGSGDPTAVPFTSNIGVSGVGDTGVLGASGALKGVGVMGDSPTGMGLLGTTVTGSGVVADSEGTGLALKVSGKSGFTRCGRASVPKGRTSVVVTVPGGLTATSLVLATIQAARPGVAVSSAVPNLANGTVRITLTGIASRRGPTPVAWWVADKTTPVGA